MERMNGTEAGVCAYTPAAQRRSGRRCRFSRGCRAAFIARSPERLLLFRCPPKAQQLMVCPLGETRSTSSLLYRDRLGTDLSWASRRALYVCTRLRTVLQLLLGLGLWMLSLVVPAVPFSQGSDIEIPLLHLSSYSSLSSYCQHIYKAPWLVFCFVLFYPLLSSPPKLPGMQG